LPVMLV